MRQTGVVVESRGKTAVVRFQKSGACGRCNACFRLGDSEAEVEIDNLLGAREGDEVVIELHGKSVFRASLIVYGVPLLALVTGAAMGSVWGDLTAALAALLFAAGAFFILRALEPRFSRMREFKPRMVEILEPTDIVIKGENDDAETPD
ncbi:MAG TPA: SoxR reducing system RseC family protein [Clostridia bacterium]|nr:SoxR reducing system RseC family protein [Clostridia bacterium]